MRLFGTYEADRHSIRVEYCAGNALYHVPEKDKEKFTEGQILSFEPFRGRGELFSVSARKVNVGITL